MKKITMRIFNRGKDVWYQDRPYKVDYVVIRGMKLFVTLQSFGLSDIPEDQLQCEPTTLVLGS